jgi:hypothetical protein
VRVGPVKRGLSAAGAAEQGAKGTWRCRTFQLAGERHDRFGVAVGEGVVELRIGRFVLGRCRNECRGWNARPRRPYQLMHVLSGKNRPY